MINESVLLDDITHWAPPRSCAGLQVLRLDKIHPVVSGNKWFKLRPNLDAARAAGYTRVLSFGGGYSNHLVALAFAAREQGFEAVGVVRGHYEELTPSLRACEEFGMRLHSVSGVDYAAIRDGKDTQLRDLFPEHWIIPEGGANEHGIQGASQIAALIPETATDICLAVGTGTTLAGLDLALPMAIQLHGYCVAKDMHQAEAVASTAADPARLHLHQVTDPRFGRWKPELLQFMQRFYEKTGIGLDVVYTGKMLQQIRMQLLDGVFVGKQLVCIHTGGLQGNPAGIFD